MSPKSRRAGGGGGGGRRKPKPSPTRLLAAIPESKPARVPPREDAAAEDAARETGESEASAASGAAPTSPRDDDDDDDDRGARADSGDAKIAAKAKGGGGDDGGGDGDSDAEDSDGSDEEEKKSSDADVDPDDGPIYLPHASATGSGLGSSGNESDWELTWPIWHMLPHDERKALADGRGFKSIGEFEEYMTLRRAMGDTTEVDAGATKSRPYRSEVLYKAEGDPRGWGAPTVAARAKDEGDGGAAKAEAEDDRKMPAEGEDEDDDVDSSSSVSETEDDAPAAAGSADNDEAAHLLALERGGLPCLLPDDVHARIFSFLDVHALSAAALVSPHWRSFTRTENVYRSLCRRVYLRQSRRKALHPHRFGGSYRSMLERRPRVRTGGGLYVLRYRQVKKIQRDMWTEIPVGAVLETVYYRCIYFHESGRALYALTTSPPRDVAGQFARRLAGTEEERDKLGAGAAVWGRYEVKRREVTLWASHPWHDVRFELRILDADEARAHDSGKYRNGAMAFERHASSASGNFDEWTSRDLVEYKVPGECFRFMPDRRL